MLIRNGFEVPLAPADAWTFLMDIVSTVPCFPGAELVETLDADDYKGRVTVKLGPLALVFNGRLRIDDRDDTAHSATVRASWTEVKGRGNANTVTRFAMAEQNGGTRIELETDVQLAGQIAQYGRGTGMIADVSAQLIARFAENLRASSEGGAPQRSDISGLTLASRALVNRFKRPAE